MMSEEVVIANKIERRFSFDGLDLPVMQDSVEVLIGVAEAEVAKALASGCLDQKMLRSILCALVHASARAQEEYAQVRDEVLPGVWTAVAFNAARPDLE